MCKLFALTDMSKVEVTPKLIKTIRDALCRHAEKDGFGYGVQHDDGSIYTEKTCKPLQDVLMAGQKETKTKGIPITLKTRESKGILKPGKAKSFVAHGRLSTNSVGLKNTHPFRDDRTALYHNGVVSNPNAVPMQLETNCDTEIAFNLWKQGGIDAVEKNAGGYYALMVQNADGNLHVTRDARANLWTAYSPTIDSWIIATTTEILFSVSKRMKWKLESPEEIKPNIYAVFNRNEIVSFRDIEPIGYVSSVSDAAAARAFGETYSSASDYFAANPDPASVRYIDLVEDSTIDTAEIDSLIELRRRMKG